MKADPFELPPPDRYEGPFERWQCPERLTAHVVGVDGDARRIAGYAVEDDLARHCGVAEVAWLALTGELPAATARAALDAALVLLAPVHIGEAPAHAAYLGRMSGGGAAVTVSIGAIGLAELAEHEHRELAPWLAWIERGGTGPVPEVALAGGPVTEAQRALDGRMRGWFGSGGGLPDVPLRRVACAYAILFRLGLRDLLAIATLATCARLPAVIAEAAHARAGDVRPYPTHLPNYQYVDDQGAAP